MVLDQDDIIHQQELLKQHRRRLAYLLQQQARLGDYAPAHVSLEIEDAQAAIRDLTMRLRTHGVAVDDRQIQLERASAGATAADTNRSKMLQKVEATWIKGVLEASLYHIARIELALEYDSDQVAYPFDTIVQRPNHPDRIMPAGTSMIELFDALNSELLILGAAGAGKTTLLLELARDLIARARQDETVPIPVVFNLSSWATRRQPLGAWLVEELNERYDVPRKLAQAWVATNKILPLLDGLDEVAAGHCNACVEAINSFRKERGFVQLAVCSRVADYELLTTRLRLTGAIVIKPLTKQQIEAYLKQIGRPLAAVRAALREDAQLWELLDNALMLSIVALAYKDKSPAKVRALGTPDERRRQLFDDYVEAMFQRRSKATHYTPEQTRLWLAWLARTMQHHSQSIFYLEHMQPDWLPPPMWRWYYTTVAVLLGLLIGIPAGIGYPNFGMVLGISMALGIAFGGENRIAGTYRWPWKTRLWWGLLVGMLSGICLVIFQYTSFDLRILIAGGIIASFIGGMAFVLAHRFGAGQNERLSAGVSIGVGVGLSVGLFIGTLVWTKGPRLELIVGTIFLGTVAGVFAGMISGLVAHLGGAISIVEKLRWSWKRAGLTAALAGLAVGVFAGVLTTWSTGLAWGLRAGAVVIPIGLTGGELELRRTPNQGIWRSARSLLWGLVIGVVVWVMLGRFHSSAEDAAKDAAWALLVGLIAGMLWALRSGLVACVQHLVLRLALVHSGAMPGNYVRFLDQAADRILLRKIGGGYIFVHRLLLEHFASQAPGEMPRFRA